MECILEANPGPEIRWFRGETAIEETTPRYSMTRKKTARDQYTLTLTVRAPTQEDGGQYRCNAVNAYGESNANIALNFAGNFNVNLNQNQLANLNLNINSITYTSHKNNCNAFMVSGSSLIGKI